MSLGENGEFDQAAGASKQAQRFPPRRTAGSAAGRSPGVCGNGRVPARWVIAAERVLVSMQPPNKAPGSLTSNGIWLNHDKTIWRRGATQRINSSPKRPGWCVKQPSQMNSEKPERIVSPGWQFKGGPARNRQPPSAKQPTKVSHQSLNGIVCCGTVQKNCLRHGSPPVFASTCTTMMRKWRKLDRRAVKAARLSVATAMPPPGSSCH